MVFFSLLPASAGFLLDLLFGPDDWHDFPLKSQTLSKLHKIMM
jgi:hypothetical protein